MQPPETFRVRATARERTCSSSTPDAKFFRFKDADVLTILGKQVQKLRHAMQEYENDRWRIISSKVGSGFSPTACREKAAEIEAQETEEEDPSGYTQSQLGAAPSDPGASYQ